jgi:lycopene cyclase domain-containing protein
MTSIVFLIWDFYFTEQGVWGFNERYLLGKYIGNLPIEEVLFFFTVPYACVFIYEVIKVYTKQRFFMYSRFLTMLLMITSWMLVYEYNDLAYTRTVFAVLGLLLFVNLLGPRKFLMNFYISYIVMLIPFFIVNGILTGTGLREPIVWYNGYEYMGIRLLSIPFEDIFYGMALILMNVTIYESIDEVD